MSDSFLNTWLKHKFAGYAGALVMSVPLLAGMVAGFYVASNEADRRDSLIATLAFNVVAFALYAFILKMSPERTILFMKKGPWLFLFVAIYCSAFYAAKLTLIN